MIDSHCHLTSCREPAAALVAAARDAGVSRMLTVGMDEDSNRAAIDLAEAHEEVFAAVGRHPNASSGFDDEAAAAIERLAAHPEVRAIGETGLDFYRDSSPPTDQRRAFRAQIEIARKVQLPLVIHVRDAAEVTDGDAFEETTRILAEETGDVAVILHCFSAPAERIALADEHSWFVSFAGNVTYPKAEGLRKAAAIVPDRLLLVETDAPYLTPQARRGQRNQPANVVETAKVVAEARGSSYEQISETVEANAARAFGW